MSGKAPFVRIRPSASRAGPCTSVRFFAQSFPLLFISHQSSRLMYAQPWSPRPLSSIAFAASIACCIVNEGPQMFQLFQPIGGVRQIVSPTLSVIVRLAVPFAFTAVTRIG